MKRKNTTRNALVMSVLSMLLCVSMLVGTTFAWFTDEVVTGMNTIAAGNLDIELLDNIIRSLSRGETLPERNKDHALTGDWIGHRECHILPDWLLVYRVEDDVLVLTLARTGTHSDLF